MIGQGLQRRLKKGRGFRYPVFRFPLERGTERTSWASRFASRSITSITRSAAFQSSVRVMQDCRKLRDWKHSHELALRVRRATDRFPRTGYASLRSQITDAAESIPFNIMECSAASARRCWHRVVNPHAKTGNGNRASRSHPQCGTPISILPSTRTNLHPVPRTVRARPRRRHQPTSPATPPGSTRRTCIRCLSAPCSRSRTPPPRA